MVHCKKHGYYTQSNPWECCPGCVKNTTQGENPVVDVCKKHGQVVFDAHGCTVCTQETSRVVSLKEAQRDIFVQPKIARSDKEPYDLTQIPFEAEKRIGAVFVEGEPKYGRDNWKNGKGNTAYQIERANHALKHLKIYIHQLTTGEYIGEYKDGEQEDDLAKVAWFCCTQMEIERLESLEECYEPTK